MRLPLVNSRRDALRAATRAIFSARASTAWKKPSTLRKSSLDWRWDRDRSRMTLSAWKMAVCRARAATVVDLPAWRQQFNKIRGAVLRSNSCCQGSGTSPQISNSMAGSSAKAMVWCGVSAKLRLRQVRDRTPGPWPDGMRSGGHVGRAGGGDMKKASRPASSASPSHRSCIGRDKGNIPRFPPNAHQKMNFLLRHESAAIVGPQEPFARTDWEN